MKLLHLSLSLILGTALLQAEPLIAPGETVTNSIAPPLDVDRYEFSAEAGDKIMVRMAVLSGDLHARVAIHSSDGTRSQPSGY
jgi:hypothetical protein